LQLLDKIITESNLKLKELNHKNKLQRYTHISKNAGCKQGQCRYFGMNLGIRTIIFLG
jgi:hypothetical protein